jgi:outer membrane protein assembly factor BamB
VLSSWLLLSCLNLTNGQVIWSKDLRAEYGGSVITYQNGASPLLDGEMIFANCNNAVGAQALLALRKSDGSLVWKGQTNRMTHATPVIASYGGVRQIIFFTQPGLISVRQDDGSVLWRYAFPYSVSSGASPVVAGDTVFCTSAYPITGAGAVRITSTNNQFTATQLWRTNAETLGAQWCTPVHYKDHLYGVFARHGYTINLKCANLATSAVKWTRTASGSGMAFGFASVVLVKKTLLVLGDTGELVLVDPNPTNYVELARAKVLSGKCWSSPAISNGRVYARSTTEGVCLDLAVPSLRLQAPRRRPDGNFQLLIGTENGSEVAVERLAQLTVRASGNLAAGFSNWVQLTNSLVLSNGVVWIDNVDAMRQSQQFFMVREPE